MMHTMPTQNPRLTITLEPLLSAQLRRLSALTGNSQSKLIAEMLQGSTGVFDRLIRVLEAAELAKGEIRGKVAEDMAQAQARVEAQLGLVLEDFDARTAPLLEGVEGVVRRARRPGAGGGDAVPRRSVAGARAVVTPLSNRGVRSDHRTKKSSAKTRG